MILKAQDILVVLKLVASREDWTYSILAQGVGMSVSEVHAGVKRAELCGLVMRINASDRPEPRIDNLLEFLIHGLSYVLPAERGALTRGIPTSVGAPPLSEFFQTVPDELVPVWPDPEGTVRGLSLKPIYRSCVLAAKRDENLYRILTVVDGLREGNARTRAAASEWLRKNLRRAGERFAVA